jgi:dihydrofolate reductase
MLKLIVAVADDWAIGYKGDLLARISTDLKRFKEITTGNAVIMGYNTLLSLPGGKPLKNRENIVLYPDEIEIEGATVVHSLEEAVKVSKKIKDKDVFVIGGGSVYNQLLPYCDTAYITKIDKHYEADTFIPNLDEMPEWKVEEESEQYYDTDGTPYRYVTYKRVRRRCRKK